MTSEHNAPDAGSPTARRAISRRGFLVAGGATAVGLGSAGWAIARSPEITFPTGTYGTTGPKVLVAYDSAYGSTGEIAQFAAMRLSSAARVDLRKIDDQLGLAGYDALVFGAPVQTDVMKESATAWLADQSADITMPMAMFMPSASFGIDPDREGQVKEKLGVLTDAADRAGVEPVGMLPCGGVVDFAKMSLAAALVYRVMSGTNQEGDFRDFTAIDEWINEVTPQLLG